MSARGLRRPSASNGLIVTAAYPESASIERTRHELANANGPGAVGSGGGTGGRNSSAACSGACIHGFSLRGRQQTKARRPPGFNDVWMLANAATGSPKNITPKREKAASKRPCPSSPVCASSFRLHLDRVERQGAAVHAARHTAAYTVLDRADLALARPVLREVGVDADIGQAELLDAVVEMAALAVQIVASVAL